MGTNPMRSGVGRAIFWRGRVLALAALVVGLSAFLWVERAFSETLATTIVVNNESGGKGEIGDEDCLLRDAIAAANTASVVGGCDGRGGGPYIIQLDFVDPIMLFEVDNTYNGPNGTPVIRSDITIQGGNKIIYRNNNILETPTFRIFNVALTGTLRLDNVQILEGGGQALEGGAIHNQGNVTVVNSLFRENRANTGGAIRNLGRLTIDNSVITFNMGGCGGAIDSGSTNADINKTVYLTVTNSLLSNNTGYT